MGKPINQAKEGKAVEALKTVLASLHIDTKEP
jgi:hypothetical protein